MIHVSVRVSGYAREPEFAWHLMGVGARQHRQVSASVEVIQSISMPSEPPDCN